MVTGCLINLIVYSAIFYGYYHWLSDTVDPPILWVISGVASFFSWVSLAAIYNIRQASRDRTALSNAKLGLPLQEGDWAAVEGQLEATRDSISAPWSGKPCVICEYEINHEVSDRSDDDSTSRTTTQIDFSGIAMTNCVVRTDHDSVSLHGFPNLENVPTQRCVSDQDFARAKQYVQTAQWQDCSGLKLFRGMKGMLHDMAEATGEFRFDWRAITTGNCLWLADQSDMADQIDARSQSYLHDGSTPQLLERRLEAGDHIVALGIYDEIQRALISPVNESGQLIRLYKGNLDSVLTQSGRSAWAKIIFGLVALVVVNGGLYLGHTIYCRSNETQQRWSDQIRQAMNQNDVEEVRRGLKRVSNANLPDREGRTLLMEVHNPLMAEILIQGGADLNARDQSGNTPLMHATRSNDFELMKQMIAAGAEIDAARHTDHTTALIQAEAAEQIEAVTILVNAGAKSDCVTSETGTSLGRNDDPVRICLQYIQAIHEANPTLLTRLSSSDRQMQWETVNWNVWHDSRPVDPELISGYVQGDNATVSLDGQTPTGLSIEWIFQLRREDGEWRISRERSKFGRNR